VQQLLDASVDLVEAGGDGVEFAADPGPLFGQDTVAGVGPTVGPQLFVDLGVEGCCGVVGLDGGSPGGRCFGAHGLGFGRQSPAGWWALR
jgi:hypothetical protein